MTVRPSEYGSRGVIGLGVPQANPTVEQEAFALRPAGVSLVTVRLVSHAPQLEARLCDYLQRLPEYLARYDDLALDAFGVACTGSSYLLGCAADAELAASVGENAGFPVITAAGAIRATLSQIGARRIGIVAPYPEWLIEHARKFWADAGYEVAEIRIVTVAGSNVHGIYELTSDHAVTAARQLDVAGVDAILLTGTGMPSLRAIDKLRREYDVPVISSNLCLMSALVQKLGLTEQLDLQLPDDGRLGSL